MLNETQKKLASENVQLISHVFKKYDWDIEQYWDVGAIGLCYAALKYDESKGLAFSTLACTCIKNEMLKIFQSQNCQKRLDGKQLLSLDQTYTDNEGNGYTLGDYLPARINVESEVLLKLMLESNYNSLRTDTERLAAQRLLAGCNTEEVRNLGHCSQTTAVNVRRKLLKGIKKGR